MVTLNPFTYGNPISDPKRFVGRQREVEQIFMRLRNPEFESSSIVGERRAGKTSLLNYIGHPDVIRSHGLDHESFLFVNLDLEMITAGSTPARLFQRMLRRIAAKVLDEGLKQEIRTVSQNETIETFDLNDVLDSLQDHGLHVVLLIDEFENVAGNDNFGPEFYYGLRSLAIHHDLALITATRVDLIELALTDAIRSSPFFNIFATINLDPFSVDDVHQMLSTYLEGTEIKVSDEEMEDLLTLAGRAPFFVQMVFYFLCEAYHQRLDEPRRLAYVEERLQEAASPHLDNYWQNSSETEKTVLALLTLPTEGPQGKLLYWDPKELERWHVHAGVTLNHLANRGMVNRLDNKYALASTTLSRWIEGEITTPADDLDNLGEQQRLELLITASLPQEAAVSAVQWLRKTNTKSRALFARWLADSRTSESVLKLLVASEAPFVELRGKGAVAQISAIGDPVLEALTTVTEAERNRAQQLASMEGTVSILFTDLEGSTELLTTLGDEQNHELLRIHNGIIRQQVANHGGLEVKALGDGFMVVFSSVRRAASCAVDIQRSLEEFNQQNSDRQLRVRIGINVGETIKEEEDFFGSAVVLSARIMDSATGSQILVSDLFRKMAANTSNLQYVDQGLKQLKGFTEEEHVYEVVWRAAGG